MKSRNDHRRTRAVRRRTGFTLVESLIAGVITAFVLGSVAMSVSQLANARNTAKLRFDAHLRADAALNAIRGEIVSILRRDDLFYTRFLIFNDSDSVRSRDENFERDGILVFNTRLRALRDIDFNGEGFEYESQFRVLEDDAGPALWVRHDAFPDEYPQGGGVVMPSAEGVLTLKFEAYDGQAWYDDWDSDIEGLPLAVRITVMACGHRDEADIYTAPRAILRTTVAIDRVISPKDLFKDPDEEEESAEDATDEEMGEETGDNGSEGLPIDPRQPPDRGGGGGDDRGGGGGRGGGGQSQNPPQHGGRPR
jgi:uncharacterized membrane protein YgcG